MWAVVTAKGRKPRPQTRTFIESWITQCHDSASDLVECERLVKQQERANKGKRARLTKNEGAINHWVGFNDLEYRFPQVRRILIDIHTATEGQHA